MRAAVVAGPLGRAAQPVVRAEIDDFHARRELGGERRRLAVRQGQEHQVRIDQGGRPGRAERQPGQRQQMRVYGHQRRPGLTVPGDGDDLQVGVPGEQAQDLTTGVPAGPGDRHPRTHVPSSHRYAQECISMQRSPDTQGANRTLT
jgi:hypothetical protein